jgi:hypothetical protein
MASDAAGDKGTGETRANPETPRHVYGPRPIAALLPRLLRPAFKGRAAATAQVLADWEAIVGPAIAAITVPRRLSAGTLVIGCSGPVAMELQHLSPTLIGRINGHLGQITVARLRFIQDAAQRAPVAIRVPSRPAIAAARAAVADFPAGALRDALERLGRAVLAQRGP